ncbi:MAG: hypothetical protein MUO75_01100 [Actinobacteria bacterium]|nr:hypothetical protein [Actinomycetota bacterium]
MKKRVAPGELLIDEEKCDDRIEAALPKDLFLRVSDEVKEKYLSLPALPGAHQAALAGEEEYCFLDFEATGFDPARDRIIEVAAARVAGEEIKDRCRSLINPGVNIPAHVEILTGISDETVSDSPTMDEFFPTLREFMGGLVVVSYSRFEENFLRVLCPKFAGIPFRNLFIDAMDLALILLPCLRSHRQADLAAMWGFPTGREHRAADDVETLISIYTILENGLYNLPLPVIKAVGDRAPEEPGGLSRLLGKVLSERSGGRPVTGLKLGEFIKREKSWVEIPPLAGESPSGTVHAEEVREVFGGEGPLAAQFSEYEERDEQLEMAEAGRRAFQDGDILLVEAGTGTGKSLAYLVPGVLWARATDMPLVVSTRTLNLQDQLSTKDLPLLQSALGDGFFSYSVLKGYKNYVCLRKLQGLINGRKSLSEDQLGIFGMLLSWLGEADSGDISMLNVQHLRGLGEIVLADHRECAGERCMFARSGDCCYRMALYRAKRSHVVVVNHSLLLAGVGLRFASAVIDEAHTLEDAATEQFTREVSYSEARRLLDSLSPPRGESGFLNEASRELSGRLDSGETKTIQDRMDEARLTVGACLEDLEGAFNALSEFHEGAERPLYDVRFREVITESPEYARLSSESRMLEGRLEKLAFQLGRIKTALDEAAKDRPDLESLLYDLEGKLARVLELKDDIDLILASGDDGFVRWATVAPPVRLESQALRASPADVGPFLLEALYEPLSSLVMTSGTLSLNDSFEFFRSRVGLYLPELETPRQLILDSSFDYGRQMEVLILHDMAVPDSEEYEKQLPLVLGKVIRAAGGGVLALFTNRRLMERVYETLVHDLTGEGLPLLCQLPGYSRRRLADEFEGDKRASLFGTSSFWEGVDASGDTLRLVVVTRIPFESPGRPVFEARSELLRREGRSDFNELSLPLAALRLKQGVGRLIRTRRDFGQVMIMDSRIENKRYGKSLLASLPRAGVKRISADEAGRAVSEFHEGS